MKIKLPTIFILAIIFTVFGCVKEHFNQDKLSKSLTDETSVAVPIGYVKNTLRELFAQQIDSAILLEDPTGLLTFKFQKGTYSLNVNNLIQYPVIDTSYSIINNTGQPIDLNGIVSPITISQTFNFDFGYSQGIKNEQIDSLLLDNMNLMIDVLASGTLNANLNTTFPGILYKKQAYSKNLVVSSSNNFSDLMAYTVNLNHTQTQKNLLKVDFVLQLQKTNRIIAPGEKIVTVNLQFSFIDFEILYGYIGQYSITPPIMPLTAIRLSNNNVNGVFNFDNAYVNLTTKNSFGVPFSFNLVNYTYQTYYSPTGKIVFQNTIAKSAPAKIEFPNLSQIGKDIYGLSTIGAGPIQLGFEDYYSNFSGSITGMSNPDGQKDYNFVKKNSQLDITSDFTVPFIGYTNNLLLTDSIGFQLIDFFSASYVDIVRLLFVVNFTNALPLDAKTQVYFCNSSGIKLDSLFMTPYVIKGSSNADGNGKVGANVNSPVKIPFEGARLDKIKHTSYLLVQSQIKTIDVDKSPPVSWKIFSDYYFYTHVGVAATIKQ